MTTQRSLVVGMTDYSGVPLEDVIEHFSDWHEFAGRKRGVLNRLRIELDALGRSHRLAEGTDHLNYCDDVFRRLEYECARLAHELSLGVQERDLDAVVQLYNMVQHADKACVEFQKSLKLYEKPSSESDVALGSVYRETRDGILAFLNLPNTIPRLRTFLGIEPAPITKGATPPMWGRLQRTIEGEARVRGRLWTVITTIIALVLAFLALI